MGLKDPEMTVFVPPLCPLCFSSLLRWSWWETPGEDQVYWYCLVCDKSGIEPCIHVFSWKNLKKKD